MTRFEIANDGIDEAYSPARHKLSDKAIKYIAETIAYLRRKKPMLSDGAIKAYQNRLVSVLNRLEDMKIPIDPTELGIREGVMFLLELHQEKVSLTTVDLYSQSLKLYTVSHGNHNLDCISTKPLKKLAHNWLSRKEVLKICETDLETEYETIFHLEICFGLDEEQICCLKVTDIDFENRLLHIPPAEGSGGPPIMLPFHEPDWLVPIESEKVFRTFFAYREKLVKWISLLNPDVAVPEELFIYEWGKVLKSFEEDSTTIVNRIRDIGKKCGVHITTGKVSRTYAHNLFYRGMTPEEIRSMTGLKTDFILVEEGSF